MSFRLQDRGRDGRHEGPLTLMAGSCAHFSSGKEGGRLDELPHWTVTKQVLSGDLPHAVLGVGRSPCGTDGVRPRSSCSSKEED